MNSTFHSELGVIVGRFQVDKLHPGHIELLNNVLQRHMRICIVIGLSPVKATRNNPLDYNARVSMLTEHLRSIGDDHRVVFRYINDEPTDQGWSNSLDRLVNGVLKSLTSNPVSPKSAMLYGSRDSFIPHYRGVYPTHELTPSSVRRVASGTALRESIANNPQATAEFRAGAIWSAYYRYPTAFPTVDVAIFLSDHTLVLGRKAQETAYRFPGGFATPDSDSFEQDAAREALEETGLVINNLEYIASMKVNDWRYRKEVDKIKTTFFRAVATGGRLEPGDDIDEVITVSCEDIRRRWRELLVETHWPLAEKLITYETFRRHSDVV